MADAKTYACSFNQIVAMLQFLVRARREGQSLWQVFWHVGTIGGAGSRRGRCPRR